MMPKVASKSVKIAIFSDDRVTSVNDLLAVELPLEIRVSFLIGRRKTIKTIATIMRTPGHDEALVTGFLFSEKIITTKANIKAFDENLDENPIENTIIVHLSDDVTVDFTNLTRNFYASSACGVCGKISLDDFDNLMLNPSDKMQVEPKIINQLPEKLHAGQDAFRLTGGIHAAGIFDVQGNIQAIYEDIGRHNAVDKLIGHFFDDRKVLEKSILVTSGRIGYEIVQKAVIAKIPMIAAIGAPSSLAVSLAEKGGITLIGFIRDNKFNIYSHAGRLRQDI